MSQRPTVRVASLLLAGLLAAGCQAADAPAPLDAASRVPGGGPIRVGVPAPPVSLDPHELNEMVTVAVLSNVCEGLVRLDPWLHVQPALATSWTSPDERRWRFELRPGVVFHDGRPLTVEDVVFSLERSRQNPKSEYGSYLVDVEAIRAVGTHAVELTSKQPSPWLLNRLAFILIVPQGAPEEIRAPVGTGPYRLSQRDGGRVIVLEAFDRHWAGAPEPREVHYVSVRGPRRADRLLAGDVDLLMELEPEEAPRVSGVAGFKVVAEPGPVVDVLYCNLRKPPLDDHRVRRAIHLALDRPALVESQLGGYGRPANQLVTRYVFGFDPSLPDPKRNLAAARSLLAESGHPDGLDLVLEHRLERPVDAIARQLGDAGIRVRPAPSHWHGLLGRLVQGEIGFAVLGLVADSGDSSDVFRSTLHSRGGGRGLGDSNDTGYSNTALDALIVSAQRTAEPQRRQLLLQQCMGTVMEDLPLIPLFERRSLYGVREDVLWEPRADARILAQDLRRLPAAP